MIGYKVFKKDFEKLISAVPTGYDPMVYNEFGVTEMYPGWGPLTVFSTLDAAIAFYNMMRIPGIYHNFVVYKVKYTKSKGTKLWQRGIDILTKKPDKLVTSLDRLKEINGPSFKEHGIELDHIQLATRVELLERII